MINITMGKELIGRKVMIDHGLWKDIEGTIIECINDTLYRIDCGDDFNVKPLISIWDLKFDYD